MAASNIFWRLGELVFGVCPCPEPEYRRVAKNLETTARLIRSGRYVPALPYTCFYKDGQFGSGSLEADVVLVRRGQHDH